MSLSVSLTALPVEPPELPDGAYADDWVLLDALNLGDAFQPVTKSSLREGGGRSILKGDPSYHYLRGVLSGMAADPDAPAHEDYAGLREVLKFIDTHGGVMVVVR